ncbi:hypothetical protein HANVADRAFT_52308 [Hanseniaspora valbyensis NRRL Y-1626]|uniref:Uncharacterized protein n=1 Tax=Hanseniaspora valbyensis NRRL Y-1626 TaxID=766949 RepID=A0A1B7TFQ3_9ASCO|nr:hypothetical protein HANVADRAFT_52308 [Hanseniaspora valbyensis NRRL Y-1626]
MSFNRVHKNSNSVENRTSIIEIKQIKQLLLQDYNNKLLKNDITKLRQVINNKFKVSTKSIIRSSLSKDIIFINFNNYQDCLYCYNNRYSLEQGIFLKLPHKPIFTEKNNSFNVIISNSNIKNKIQFYNELREFLPEGIVNIEHYGKSGKYIVSFEDVKIYKICLKLLKDVEIRLSNGSVITTSEMKNNNRNKDKSDYIANSLINAKPKGKKMSRIDKIKKIKHFNFKESDTRSIVTFKVLNDIKILNNDKKLKYRLLKKTNNNRNKPTIYTSSEKVNIKPKNIDKRIIPVNFDKKKKILLSVKKDPDWNVNL